MVAAITSLPPPQAPAAGAFPPATAAPRPAAATARDRESQVPTRAAAIHAISGPEAPAAPPRESRAHVLCLGWRRRAACFQRGMGGRRGEAGSREQGAGEVREAG